MILRSPPPVADVRSLTHYGEPYDGNTRFFRRTLFIAAVRSCYGESCLLHGVDWMAPKVCEFSECWVFWLFKKQTKMLNDHKVLEILSLEMTKGMFGPAFFFGLKVTFMLKLRT